MQKKQKAQKSIQENFNTLKVIIPSYNLYPFHVDPIKNMTYKLNNCFY